MSQKKENPFEKISAEEALSQLKTSQEKGLYEDEAKKRFEQYGPNAIEEKKKSVWSLLLSFFWGPIPWMIEIAAILSFALERWADFSMIIALLIINSLLGFFQEYRAGNAIEALKNSLALKARVLREGKWRDIEAKELVPGDIIEVKLGNILPADLKLLSGEFLSVDQSALTGESLPVTKKVGDVAYSGTIAKMGEMQGVVIGTGMNTFFGKTAKLVSEAKTTSHFQKAVLHIGHLLIFSTLGIAAILFILELFRIEVTHKVHESLGQLMIFLLVLIIAGIPVAMPAVLSMTMAIGAHRMAKLKAIVSKLIAIEELAGMDVLCSDKTGTLTKNELSVGEVAGYGGVSEKEILLSACLASNLRGVDAIDQAIRLAYNDDTSLQSYKQTTFTPFDPVKKRTEATAETSGGVISISKGAPQVILELTEANETLRKEMKEKIDTFAAKGFRTLGVARKKTGERSWSFLGLIALLDPPREDTKSTIEKARQMSVDIKMVTGDHTAIAKQIASQLELGENIIPMHEMSSKEIPESEQDRLIDQADGFAEVYPEDKFAIVKKLQAKKHIVGMTGDGVNDAPALKQADIGIAVGGATDAARAAADLVLTEKGLFVITRALEEARYIFGRMKSYAMYRISETVRLLLFLFLAMAIFGSHPLTAIMIILVALLNDIPIMMIAYDHMELPKKPAAWDMKEVMTIAIGLAIMGVVSTFGLFWIGTKLWHFDTDSARTLSFFAILCGGNLTIYLTRNRGVFWARPLPEWRFFLATLFSQIVGTLLTVYGIGTSDFVGIGWTYVGYCWLYILGWFLFLSLVKRGLYSALQHSQFQ